MRILFDHQIFSLQARGGISRYVSGLAEALNLGRMAEAEIFAGYHGSQLLREHRSPWIRGHYVPLLPRTLRLRRRLNDFLTRRRLHSQPADVVHETYFRASSNYPPHNPTVVTVHDLIHFLYPEVEPGADELRRIQQAAIARATRIICVSENTKRDLLRCMPVASERITVIHLGVSFASRPLPPLPSTRRDAERYLLHVGPRQGYKNFDLLLRVLAERSALPENIRVVAFGGGAFTPQEHQRVRELGLDPARIIHRTGDDAALERCYLGASALVCPSRYEGFGLPPLEAMALGCPVVSSRGGSLPEIVGNAALLFDPENTSELMEALVPVLTSPALVNGLRVRGQRRAAEFSWEKCASQTAQVYRELSEKSLPSRR
jgi:glycosyltransferase involved in cell wall biosynthesis